MKRVLTVVLALFLCGCGCMGAAAEDAGELWGMGSLLHGLGRIVNAVDPEDETSAQIMAAGDFMIGLGNLDAALETGDGMQEMGELLSGIAYMLGDEDAGEEMGIYGAFFSGLAGWLNEEDNPAGRSFGAEEGDSQLFSEWLDEREKFFNEYVDFMAEYAGAADQQTLEEEYSGYRARYKDELAMLEEIDRKNLTDEEYEAYRETLTRIQLRLMRVME